jgi:hypothetical protein
MMFLKFKRKIKYSYCNIKLLININLKLQYWIAIFIINLSFVFKEFTSK